MMPLQRSITCRRASARPPLADELMGIVYKIAATLVFAVMSALIKSASADYNVAQIVFFRSFIALLVTLCWLYMQGQFPKGLSTLRPFGHVLRSVCGGMSMALNFAALALLPLPDVTALGYITPLLICVIAAVMLGEAVSLGRVAAVLIGFVGVMIMLWDHLHELHDVVWGSGGGVAGVPPATWGVIIVLSSTGFLAVAMIQTRRLAQSEHVGAIVFYFQSTTMALSLLVMIVAPLWPPPWWGAAFVAAQSFHWPDQQGFVMLVCIGITGGVGQIFMTQSYRHADASIIAIFDYTSLLWTSALGLVFFDDVPNAHVIMGAVVVAGSSLFVIWSENRSRRAEALLETRAL
jgi:drug/metabolite transporter (DMT)-like permease